jgi:hypothetical protein
MVYEKLTDKSQPKLISSRKEIVQYLTKGFITTGMDFITKFASVNLSPVAFNFISPGVNVD